MRWLALLLLLPLLTSCTALPAEERAFAVALMVDKRDDTWRVHARIPTYKTGGGYVTVRGEGASPDAALADMDAAAPMHIHLSQLRLLVLDAALGGEAYAVMLALTDRADMRPQCAVAATEDPADAVMEALQPATGARLSKGLDVLLDTRTAQGGILPSPLSRIVRMGERQSPVLTAMTVTDGAIDLAGGWAMGAAGLIPLTAEETALLALLHGDVKDVTLRLSGGTAHVRDAAVKAVLQSDERSVHVTLTMTAVASALTSGGLEAALAEDSMMLLARLYREGCDALGLGRQAILGASDMAGWHAMDWPGVLPQLQWTVSVGVSGPA